MPPRKEPPIVWYLDSESLGPVSSDSNKLELLREAIDEFNKGDKTLDWLDEEFKKILGDSYE